MAKDLRGVYFTHPSVVALKIFTVWSVLCLLTIPSEEPWYIISCYICCFFCCFFFYVFWFGNQMCVLPPWFHKSVASIQGHGGQQFWSHSCILSICHVFIFFPTRPTAAQEAGVHWPQNALNEIVQLQLCLPMCDFMRVLPIFRRTASDMMNRMQFVWLHLFTWACNETSWIHRFHKVVHKHVLLFVCSLAIIFSSASCLTYNRRFVLYD